jgi:hypothetical protein
MARTKWDRYVTGLANPTVRAISSTGAEVLSSNGRLAWIRCVISQRVGLVPVHRAKWRR